MEKTTLYNHFKDLNPVHESSDEETSDHHDTDETGPLDYPITENEIDDAIKSLKRQKALGNDNVLNETLMIGKDVLKPHLEIIFNRILVAGKYPASWNLGLIVPIHKKDDPSKAENYRGITLLSALSKTFTFFLNKRLYAYLVETQVLKSGCP